MASVNKLSQLATSNPSDRSDSPMVDMEKPTMKPTRVVLTRAITNELPKSASYTYLPTAKDSSYSPATPFPVTIRGDTSSEDLVSCLDSTDVTPPDSSGWTTPSDEIRAIPNVVLELEAELQKIPRVSIDTVRSNSEKRLSDSGSSQDVEIELENPTRAQRTFVRRLSKRMSYLSSRSPSPSKSEEKRNSVGKESKGDNLLSTRGLLRRKNSTKAKDAVQSSNDSTPVATPIKTKHRPTLLSTKSSKQEKKPVKTASLVPMQAVPRSFSTDRLHAVVENAHEDFAALPLPSPRMLNTDKNASMVSLAMPKKRDELWSVFRSLDGDYAKFSSKSTPFKASVVRGSLLPFLRTYATHPSNRSLRPEDLDRRVSILNKWWVGLLELLHGKNNQSLSGTDRPAILDGLSGLMDRPEWRPSPSPFCPLEHRTVATPTLRNKSTTSLGSTESDFLTESVMHNVRNLFIQNLNNQMTFVVEKMSLRNASASLISLCGKAIAYAFIFCPGLADVLVRLWHTDGAVMKRILGQHGVSKFDNIKATSDDVANGFPPAVRSLAFNSLSKMLRSLKQPAELPPASANLQMYGYWSDRWLGRESDLLYVFVKHYFILANDYLAPDASKREIIAAPGMLLVQAQILANLDSTIKRDVSSPADGPIAHSPSFDDFLGGPDAIVSTIPLLPPNAMRIMSENRLIMLIRDFLSDRAAEHQAARHLFANTFGDLLRASARNTSAFSHPACYTLCDFLEEALVILVRYENSPNCPAPVIDSAFWREVCEKMLTSQNTVTEIRLYAFLYTSWPVLCSNPQRKEDLCLNLLLDKEIFERGFLHWCPMVRAYFMRLVCWRMGRYDGEATELDTRILETLSQRLRDVWRYRLHECEDADRKRTTLPPTAACSPAPGRKFVILRTDTQVAPGGAFLAFNGIIPPIPARLNPDLARDNILSPDELMDRPLSAISTDSENNSEREETGLRGFLRGIMGSSRKRSQSRDSKGRAPSRAGEEGSRPRDRAALSRSPSRGPAHRSFCFKFSLEFVKGQKAEVGAVSVLRPQMPRAAEEFVRGLVGSDEGLGSVVPVGEQVMRLKYVGRSLAEWNATVTECQGFFDRRKAEGVPEDKMVETPTLGVELFRR